MTTKEKQACVYAALVLHDGGVPLTSSNIQQTVEAAGVDVSPVLPILFARYLEKNSINSLATMIGAAASQPAAAAAPAAPQEEAKKPEAKPEPEEDEDEGGLGGLFD